MSDALECDIAVIGAGVVGLCVAYHLAREGRDVILVDPEEPGSGASFGNAGTVADYAVQPVGTPDVLRNLPSLLFDRNSPLSIRHAALPTLAPWLLRFARQSLPGAAQRNAGALVRLLADATPRWRDLASAIGGADLLRQRGCIYMFESAGSRRAAENDLTFRRGIGVTVELLSPEELTRLEPALPGTEGGGAWFPQAIFMTDPGRMMAGLAQAAIGSGARVIKASATGLIRDMARVGVVTTLGPLNARHVVIAAGAHSRMLARAAGDRIPLDTERGYHVEYDMTAPRLSRPVCPTSRGFYLCPMAGRLRAAGTVELGGLSAPQSPHRIARLDAGARAIFADLPVPDRSWMGFRPSLPDSLPVIGPSSRGGNILHAYGHGHIGLTLAPITAAMISAMIAGKAPPIDPHAFRADRF